MKSNGIFSKNVSSNLSEKEKNILGHIEHVVNSNDVSELDKVINALQIFR